MIVQSNYVYVSSSFSVFRNDTSHLDIEKLLLL